MKTDKLEVVIRALDKNKPYPVILFVQGLGMTLHETDNSFDEISKRLVAAGFRTFQVELPIFDKDGKCTELPLSERAMYVEDIAQKYKVEGLIAQSYGVATVLESELRSITSQVFISGAFFPKKNLLGRFQSKMTIHYYGDTALPRSSGIATHVNGKFWKDIKEFDDMKTAGNIRKSTLIIHGDKDDKIPVIDVQMFYQAIPAAHKKLKIFSGGDHGIVDVPRDMREEFLQDIVAWFTKTL